MLERERVLLLHHTFVQLARRETVLQIFLVQGGSNMTGTDLCVNKPHLSRSYLNHLVSITAKDPTDLIDTFRVKNRGIRSDLFLYLRE